MSEDKKEKKIKARIKKKKVIAVIGTIIVGIIYAFALWGIIINEQYNQYYTQMFESISSAKAEYNSNVQKDDIYSMSNENTTADLAGYAAFYLEQNNGFSLAKMDELTNDIGNYAYVFYMNGTIDDDSKTVDGTVYKELRGIDFNKDFDLSEEEMYELLSTGVYHKGAQYYNSSKVGDAGYVILAWVSVDLLKNQSFLSAVENDSDMVILRVDSAAGVVDDASHATYLNKPIEEVLGRSLDSFEPNILNRCSSGDGILYVVTSEDEYGKIFCAFTNEIVIELDLLRIIIIPIILGWIFLGFLLKYVMRFLINHVGREKETTEYLKLYKDRYVNRKLASHVGAMMIFAMLLIIIPTIYVKSLVNYGKQNIVSESGLRLLEKLIDLNNMNEELMLSDNVQMQEENLDCVANFFMRYPEQLSLETLENLANKMPNVRTITFFDNTGTSVYSVGNKRISNSLANNIGYTLSRDASSPENVCWDVLWGDKSDVTYLNDYDYGSFYIVGRRQDAEGIIRIEVDASYLNDFISLTDPIKVVGQTYFGDSSKLFVNTEQPERLYMLEPLSNHVYEKTNNLPDSAMETGYSGTNRIDGVRYYINSRKSSDGSYVIMSAIPVLDLNGLSDGKIAIVIFLIFMLYWCGIMLISAKKHTTAPIKAYKIRHDIQNVQNFDEKWMDDYFIKAVQNMLIALCIVIVCFIGFDAMFGRMSLISYLFRNEWSKGLNLFSVTMMIIVVAIAVVCARLLRKSIELFTRNMGPRGVTIGRLISSLIRFAMLIIVVILVLANAGINLGTLLAGAGIIGALISFCAQQTVNDFLSGFFIVFEGLYNIGDWITVKDFRGQVIDIGIRTTKIACGDNIQIINNSELKTVTLMATNFSGAICTFDVAYEEDIDAVIALIKDNAKRYAEEIPYMIDGPYVDGVINLGDSGVTIRIWATANQGKVNATEREMRRITKDLFDENGITIPFNQVTIHNAD